MKTPACSLIFLFLILGSPFFSYAQEEGDAPPARVRANFNAKYPEHSGATSWKQTTEGYQATLTHKNNKVISDFDTDGRWVKSRSEVKEQDIPNAARQYMKDSYNPYNFKKGWKYDNKTASHYEIDIQSGDKDYRLEFDKNGGIVKEGTIEGSK